MAASTIARTIFVISDLHLGGAPPDPTPTPKSSPEHLQPNPISPGDLPPRGFRMMTATSELKSFIDYVATQPASELVINGDFVDFLAEKHESGTFHAFLNDEERALETFHRIAGHPLTGPEPGREQWDPVVFDALNRFLATGRSVTILLGNHDLELSFPRVREAMVRRLGGGNLFFRYDNEALSIGPDILIEHGNLYDRANAVDHDDLRRFRMELTRKTPDAKLFSPPPGSRLVAEIMNPGLKAKLPFVDLLKPESDALFALLIALAPECRDNVTDLIHLLVRQPWAPGNTLRSSGTELPTIEAREHRTSPIPTAQRRALGILAADLAKDSQDGSSGPFQAPVTGKRTRSLGGKLDLLRMLLTGHKQSDNEHALAIANLVANLNSDTSFSMSGEFGTYAKWAGQNARRGNFRCVVFGHTHLAKDEELVDESQKREPYHYQYLNSGTWADIMEFPKLQRGDLEGALELLNNLRSSTLTPYLRTDRRTFVRLDLSSDDRLLEAATYCFLDGQPKRLRNPTSRPT